MAASIRAATLVQPPRVCAVNDLFEVKRNSISCPRTWAGWIPVTSTGMREGKARPTVSKVVRWQTVVAVYRRLRVISL